MDTISAAVSFRESSRDYGIEASEQVQAPWPHREDASMQSSEVSVGSKVWVLKASIGQWFLGRVVSMSGKWIEILFDHDGIPCAKKVPLGSPHVRSCDGKPEEQIVNRLDWSDPSLLAQSVKFGAARTATGKALTVSCLPDPPPGDAKACVAALATTFDRCTPIGVRGSHAQTLSYLPDIGARNRKVDTLPSLPDVDDDDNDSMCSSEDSLNSNDFFPAAAGQCKESVRGHTPAMARQRDAESSHSAEASSFSTQATECTWNSFRTETSEGTLDEPASAFSFQWHCSASLETASVESVSNHLGLEEPLSAVKVHSQAVEACGEAVSTDATNKCLKPTDISSFPWATAWHLKRAECGSTSDIAWQGEGPFGTVTKSQVNDLTPESAPMRDASTGGVSDFEGPALLSTIKLHSRTTGEDVEAVVTDSNKDYIKAAYIAEGKCCVKRLPRWISAVKPDSNMCEDQMGCPARVDSLCSKKESEHCSVRVHSQTMGGCVEAVVTDADAQHMKVFYFSGGRCRTKKVLRSAA